ncbi:hypothetical protein CSIM01_01023 [Colletotrichum simmondsii]|uniref:Uncharacterized protein n=1 Tax=Colletotrichum simmondsii TaxID=703756 RepID=A0A135S065_9PEZI|nr:hypothetical protein CSIM01_01023 [Colletotrichum simmondsii]
MKLTLLLTVASSLAIASAKTCQWTRKSCSPNGGQISMQAWIDHSRELCTRIGGSPQGIYSDQVICDAPGYQAYCCAGFVVSCITNAGSVVPYGQNGDDVIKRDAIIGKRSIPLQPSTSDTIVTQPMPMTQKAFRASRAVLVVAKWLVSMLEKLGHATYLDKRPVTPACAGYTLLIFEPNLRGVEEADGRQLLREVARGPEQRSGIEAGARGSRRHAQGRLVLMPYQAQRA